MTDSVARPVRLTRSAPRAFSALAVSLIALTAGGTVLAEKADGGCKADTMVVFDASGSMLLYTDGQTRLDMARRALAEVLPEMTESRRTGLVTYGGVLDRRPPARCGNIEMRLPPKRDAAPAILDILGKILPQGWTPATAAVEYAAEALGYREKSATIVLVTDGEENCGGSPCAVAQTLRSNARNLVVHVVGYFLGPQQAMQVACLATETGGLYVPAHSFDELRQALRKVARCPEVS